MPIIPITLPSKSTTYTVYVEAGSISDINRIYDISQYSKVFVITDTNLEKLWLEPLLASLPGGTGYVALRPGESEKHIESVGRIWQELLRAGCDRGSLVIMLGGGVIGDIGGFAASTYMRGVPFIHIPTSLLAQIDSSIGGKTGIDFGGIKNLVGTFDQPVAVVIDPNLLKTLPEREFISGFGEIIKHGLIKDSTYFAALEKASPLLLNSPELVSIITTSCQIKADVVRDDELESGSRKLLNFGHTVGHAIEALSLESDRPLLHGEAVSIGMVIEAELSLDHGLQPNDLARITRTLKNYGLPTTCPTFEISKILERMRSDKKNLSGSVRFTLLSGIGSGIWDVVVAEDTISDAINKHMVAA